MRRAATAAAIGRAIYTVRGSSWVAACAASPATATANTKVATAPESTQPGTAAARRINNTRACDIVAIPITTGAAGGISSVLTNTTRAPAAATVGRIARLTVTSIVALSSSTDAANTGATAATRASDFSFRPGQYGA